MIWHIIRYWISFILPIFYKKIQGRNIKNIQQKGPIIIAMNHPNAFTDPILITYLTSPIKVNYLARGDAFKPGLISWLLSRIGIVPIYRIQDGGKEGLKKNDDAYRLVNKLLKNNAKIIVFAEGLCVQERRLRPLKKGVSRMVFGAYDFLGQNNNLMVVPVGINYSKASKPRSNVFYNVGEPIKVIDFIEQHKQNQAKANTLFLQELQPKMKELITHINNPENDEAVEQIEILCKKDRIKELRLNHKNLYHDFIVLKELTEKVNKVEIENPMLLNEFKLNAKNYFNELNKHQLKDWIINSNSKNKISITNLALLYFILILGFPLFFIGFASNFLPYKITKYLTQKIVKNKEFYSSFAIALSMIFFLVNYTIIFSLIYQFSNEIFFPLLTSLVFMLSGWFGLFYYPVIYKTRGVQHALLNPEVYNQLSTKRRELINLINKF
jgi:glycerol-3-phosphate O-acyltransferase/dihydroxyacetone phosphate acyltransferase